MICDAFFFMKKKTSRRIDKRIHDEGKLCAKEIFFYNPLNLQSSLLDTWEPIATHSDSCNETILL